MRTTLLIVAAGSGTRLQAGRHKALVDLGDGRSMLEHCLESVARAAQAGALDPAAIVVVVPADAAAAEPLEDVCRRAANRLGLPVECVPGGAERSDSVRAGLAAIRAGASDPSGGPFRRQAVLVHDAARPFVPPPVFRAVAEALRSGATAVVPGVPVVDTIKTVAPPGQAPADPDSEPDGETGGETRDESGGAGQDAASGAGPAPGAQAGPEWVTGTPDRTALRAVQTPQGFDLTALEAAHRAAAGGPGLTDDAMVMEAAGHRVAVVSGDPRGFKVTTPLDLVLARALLQEDR
ncbi:MAG TPA: 2-C-methyl-D-erythritol 4-phosphate cytidylyltransferase [Citricoccus sp.]